MPLKNTSNKAPEYGPHEFCMAAEQGNARLVSRMLSEGMDVNAINRLQQTALQCAAAKGQTEVAELLLDAGADPNLCNPGSYFGAAPALCLACHGGHTKVAGLLLDRGARLDGGGSSGHTPLHCAVTGNHQETANFLIDRGADMSARTRQMGWTPLHVAVWQSRLSMAMLLFDRGAEIDAKSSGAEKTAPLACGCTPLDIALDLGDEEMIKFLRSAQRQRNVERRQQQVREITAARDSADEIRRRLHRKDIPKVRKRGPGQGS